MATVERNSVERGEAENQFPVDSSASGDGKVAKEDGWRKYAEDRLVPPPEQTEKFVVTDPKTGEGHRGLIKSFWDLIFDHHGWQQSCQISDPVQQTVQAAETWQTRISLLLLKFLWFVNGPFKALGSLVEDALNLFSANGGFFKALDRALFNTSDLLDRGRNSEDYLSIGGALDPGFGLYIDTSSVGLEHQDDADPIYFPGTDYGSRSTADVLVMASKLAYENRACVEKVVNELWKMNFVKFYDCWNRFLEQSNTQVFLFTDRPENARAVVVAFRGTEPFNALDWSTDFDFAWFEIPGLGRVHVGFLEALGLVDRKRMGTFVTMRDNARVQLQQSMQQQASTMPGLHTDGADERILAFVEVTKKINDLMNKNPDAKLFVTGHSLGGALANLYTTLFFFFNNEEAVSSRFGALYTFGQPRVGGPQYCQYMISKVQESRYRRIVFGDDLVPRVPFDNNIFQFKHSGCCYYYNDHYEEETIAEAPNRNYFSISFLSLIVPRLVALYELFVSLISGWIYGPEVREIYSSRGLGSRLLRVITPGLGAHTMNNYVNAIRFGPTSLQAPLAQ